MSKYLYGASVQGIQEFIFATNKLQEIVGASEIVKSVAVEFEKLSGYKNGDKNLLINTAGNIKAIFNTKEECEKVVLEFGKIISQMAYGITISQAVVEFDGKAEDYITKLSEKLKTQRNKPSIPLDSSINIMELNPSTAKPSISNGSDIATIQKLKAYKELENKENSDLQKLSNSKNKLAVIHIDGNALGQLISNLKKECNLTLSEFSSKLDAATKKAFNDAKEGKQIREIILGGDDVTVICNADNALDFTKEFLENFETQTDKSFKKLTACAGIAYCNEKYPFHYAVDLAEALCGVAKNHCKRESSCLMFHNIQSSSYQEWDKFVKDELTIKNDQETIRCDFGAYYLDNKNEANISDFMNTLEAYRCDNSPINRLRNWLSELYKSDENAKNLLYRINSIVKQNDNWNCEIMDKNLKYFDKNLSNDTLIVEKYTEKEKREGATFRRTPIYDILQILSITEAK